MTNDGPAIIDARFIASAQDYRDLPAPLFSELAFAGKSNVGKSSLINTLLARRALARTSSTPGRTRTLNLLRVELRGSTLDLVDLPGYGYASVSHSERRSWGPMIEGFLTERVGLCGVVVILDIRRGLQPDDQQLLEFLADVGHPAILVATKLDKLAPSKAKPALQALRKAAGQPVLAFSAVTRSGRAELWEELLGLAELANPEAPAESRTP